MGSPLLNEMKRQASFFLKEKIKAARLAITDVTPAQLLTEEAVDGDFLAADTRSMALISRAAFEVDDYWRIVDILHNRLTKFDRKIWRVSYKTLVVLEHLLTHGPLRVADEFQTDKNVIREIGGFQFVDEKGFNWGWSVNKLSARVLNLLESETFLKEERARARQLTRGIRGFGSFSRISHDGNLIKQSNKWLRSYSSSNDNNQDYEVLAGEDYDIMKEHEFMSSKANDEEKIGRVEDHPFCYTEDYHTKAALLSF